MCVFATTTTTTTKRVDLIWVHERERNVKLLLNKSITSLPDVTKIAFVQRKAAWEWLIMMYI